MAATISPLGRNIHAARVVWWIYSCTFKFLTSTSINALQKAGAELAYELQAAKTKQRIKEEQMQILVVERSQEIAVQDQEIQRRERELEATIRRPAEAEKYKYDCNQVLQGIAVPTCNIILF